MGTIRLIIGDRSFRFGKFETGKEFLSLLHQAMDNPDATGVRITLRERYGRKTTIVLKFEDQFVLPSFSIN